MNLSMFPHEFLAILVIDTCLTLRNTLTGPHPGLLLIAAIIPLDQQPIPSGSPCTQGFAKPLGFSHATPAHIHRAPPLPPPPTQARERAGGRPPHPPPPPPAPTSAGEPRARPSAPPGPGGHPPPQEERRRGKGNGGWACSREPTPACRSNAHNGTGRRPRPT